MNQYRKRCTLNLKTKLLNVYKATNHKMRRRLRGAAAGSFTTKVCLGQILYVSVLVQLDFYCDSLEGKSDLAGVFLFFKK